MSPAGLDGNPDPITTPMRTAVVAVVAEAVAALPAGRRIVAIDGIDGAGKSTFADELARAVTVRSERPLVRSTVDSFHNPRAVRHERGRDSPDGFYLDSHDLATLGAALLEPFRAGGPVRLAAFDEPTDTVVDATPVRPRRDAVLVFDGIFLQRPELERHWDLVIYLDGRKRVEQRRLTRVAQDRPPGGPAALLHDLHWWSLLRRYVDGQRRYHDECDPVRRAHLVVLNDDFRTPVLLRP